MASNIVDNLQFVNPLFITLGHSNWLSGFWSCCFANRDAGCNVGNTLPWLYVVSRDCNAQFWHDIKWHCCCRCCLLENFTLAMRRSESIARFEPYNEADDIEEYFEWLELFFEVHKITAGKKVAHLLSDIGPKTYTVLKSLTTPALPAECEFKRLKEVLVQHYKPKPLIIVERFAFHKRDQWPEEKTNDFLI